MAGIEVHIYGSVTTATLARIHKYINGIQPGQPDSYAAPIAYTENNADTDVVSVCFSGFDTELECHLLGKLLEQQFVCINGFDVCLGV